MTSQKESSDLNDFRDELSERGREVWLAGLGALATVEEEGTKLFNQLIDRGQEFEEERREEIKEVADKARDQRDEALSQIEEIGEETQSTLTETVNTALERFGVPSQTEVDRLADKVDTLSQQVEELADALAEDDGPATPEET